jgi:iron(III) transport system substrate-binding protein
MKDKPMTISRRQALLGAIATAGVAALPGRVLAAEGWDATVAAAKKEGTLVLYASTTGSMHGAVIAAFEKAYGLQVKLVGGRGNEFAERIRTEQINGRYNGDVTINGKDTLISHDKRGNLQAHGTLPNLKKVDASEKYLADVVPVLYGAYSMFVNTNLVRPADEPKTWQDLLDPKWVGQIILDDPRVISSGNAFFRVMQFNYGTGYVEKLKAQKPVITLDLGGAQRQVLLGQYPILVPDDYKFYIDAVNKGANLPVKIIAPQQGVIGVRFDAGMLKNAPHPAAANLFLNFLLSPTAQLAYANDGRVPLIKEGVLDKVNPKIKSLLSAPVLPLPPSDRQQEYLQMAQKIFGKV